MQLQKQNAQYLTLCLLLRLTQSDAFADMIFKLDSCAFAVQFDMKRQMHGCGFILCSMQQKAHAVARYARCAISIMKSQMRGCEVFLFAAFSKRACSNLNIRVSV